MRGITVGSGFAIFFGPESFSPFADFFGQGIGSNERGRVMEETEKGQDIFAENEDPGFAKVSGFGIALAFGDDEQMIAVGEFFDLRGIGARANRFEIFLKEDFWLGLVAV